mmetsp:Transcript_10493/g.12766  ORF Transcript_10493/g.12766 Transcript_10493/m.12766 type:complete len:180 (+) Transcript_10493:59-598(+)
MMRDKFSTLYILRFFGLLFHAITTSFLYQLVPVLVQTGLSVDATNDAYLKRETSLVAFISLSLVFLAGDALLMVVGVSLRSPFATLFNILCHGLGSFFTLWVILDGWTWQSVPYMFAFFIFTPFSVEILAARPLPPTLAFGRRVGSMFCKVGSVIILFVIYWCEYVRQMCRQRSMRPLF